MNLNSPITIQPRSITRKNGEVRVQRPITITELDVTIIDNAKTKCCYAKIYPCPFRLELWREGSYDAAGDYTQAQAEARRNCSAMTSRAA